MDLSALIFAALKSANTANERIDNLPLPMVFKGSLGTGGTISTLPTASTENEGFVYIVITDGTYAGQSAKAGDTFVSDGSSWVLVPSADEPSVIDDSVTSTALTWSSDKLSGLYNEVKVKSFSYKGNGDTTNNIVFSEIPKVIISIDGTISRTTYALLNNIHWNKTQSALTTVVTETTSSVACYGIGCSYDNDNKTLILTGDIAAKNFNLNNVTYTVYYI